MIKTTKKQKQQIVTPYKNKIKGLNPRNKRCGNHMDVTQANKHVKK